MALIRTCLCRLAPKPRRRPRSHHRTTRIALRSLARRILALEEEIADLDELITPL
jgi:hypothetical protein